MAKYCAHCGKQISDTAVFCKFCGEKVKDEREFIDISETESNNSADDGIFSKKTIIIIAVAIVLAIITAAVGAVMYFGKTSDAKPVGETEEESVSSDITDEDAGISSKGSTAKSRAVIPLYADASSQHEDMGDISYYPENAIDNDLATAWVEGVDGEGQGEWLSVTFDNEEPIEALRIRNGYQKSEEAYNTNNRVKTALVEFEDGSVERFTLKDMNNTEQVVVFSEAKRGNAITIIIQSAYLSHDDNDTCITEIGIIESGMEYPAEAEIVYSESY